MLRGHVTKVLVPNFNEIDPKVTGVLSRTLVMPTRPSTLWPYWEGFGNIVNRVSVSAQESVITVKAQPPARKPTSPPAASTTYKLHVPFATSPLKTEREELPEAPGAGAGNKSPKPLF